MAPPLEATPQTRIPLTPQAAAPPSVTQRKDHHRHLPVGHFCPWGVTARAALTGRLRPAKARRIYSITGTRSLNNLRAAKRIELFLDFDGTLVEFRFGPDQVSLGGKSRVALTRLAQNPLIGVAIVSGRRSAALRKFIKVPGVRFMGLYGWEGGVNASGRRKKHSFPPRTLRQLSTLRRTLKTLPVEIPGIRVEDKGLSLAIHFRGASAAARGRLEARMRAIGRQFRGDLQVLGANCVWDIVPRQVRGKGAAIREAMARVPAKTLPIFLGDDLTDEPAFAALRRGVTILVGPGRPTRARFRLRNPGEVRVFLERLGEALHEQS